MGKGSTLEKSGSPKNNEAAKPVLRRSSRAASVISSAARWPAGIFEVSMMELGSLGSSRFMTLGC